MHTNIPFNVKEYGSDSDKAVFFFCPLGTPSWQFALPGMPIWHLSRNNYRVISYSYGLEIATESVQGSIDNFRAILDDASKRLSYFDSKTIISSFGSSIGTVFAANLTARNDRISKVVLNITYADIAEHIIYFPPTRTIPKKALKKYVNTIESVDKLRETFNPYSPINMVSNFHNKRILLYISLKDKLLQFNHTIKFYESLKEHGVNVKYYENKVGGHTYSVLINSLRFHRYMEFLNEL